VSAVRFGVGFEHADMRRQIEYARMAERLGFSSYWVPEDYFFRGAFTVASALACSTTSLRIGLGVVNPFTRHPALIAMEFAALSELAPDRTVLGIGAGVGAWLDQMRLRCVSPGIAIREAVEIIRRILGGEQLSFAGKIFRTDKVALSFKPATPRLPIYLGVLGPKNLAMAGAIADGVMLSVMTSPAYAAYATERIRAGAQAAGRGEQIEAGAFLLASISDDDRRARDAIKPLLAGLIALMASQPRNPLFVAAGLDPDEVIRFGQVYASGELPVRMVTDAMVDTFAIAGDPDRCRAALSRIIDAGITHPVFFEVPGIEGAETIRMVHRHLMPHFL
jgi:5,10-methylenetetrahydromethanopterin reductase